MQIQIILPPTYDFSTADECAMHMADAVIALERRLKPKVEHGVLTPEAAERKLHLYLSIAGALDAILSALDDSELTRTERITAKQAQEAVASLPPGVAKPSATKPDDQLVCLNCGKVAPSADFIDGRVCPVEALRLDFFACPGCSGFEIFIKEI